MQLLSQREQSARADDVSNVHSFASDAFVHGGVIGVKSFTHIFPKSLAVIIRFFAPIMTSRSFTTVVLQEGVMAPLHSGSHNVRDSKNLLVSQTPCADAILWVEDPNGDSSCPVQGTRIQRFLLHSPARLDSVANNDQSKRFAAVAFSIRDVHNTRPDDCLTLRERWFGIVKP